MARTREDIERDLEARGRPFQVLDDDTIIVPLATGQAPAMLRVEPPVVVMQVNIGEVSFRDDTQAAAFYRELLVLNATSLMHAAYGLDGSRVVLSAALALDNLDSNELEATLADLSLALGEQVPALRQMVTVTSKG
jgi:hypothetical protein